MLFSSKQRLRNRRNVDVGKRVLSTILAVVMVLGLMPELTFGASAADLPTSVNTRRTLNNGESWTLPAGSFSNVCYAVNGNVTVTVNGTTTINNQSVGGSPFTLNSGATLNLVVNGRLNVYGQNAGNGVSGINADTYGTGGAGGYAGISVPTGTTLNISGSGSLYSYGGDA